jgi:hypothetical protein
MPRFRDDAPLDFSFSGLKTAVLTAVQAMGGALPEGVDYNDDGFCKLGCLFADFGGALHNIRFDRDMQTFKSWRVGDAESVSGVRVP